MSYAHGPNQGPNEDTRAYNERYRLWREQYKQQEELIEQQKRAADEAERANKIAQERASQPNWTPENAQAVRNLREETVHKILVQLKDQIISLENKVMMLEVELEKRIGESDKRINQISYYLSQKDENGFKQACEWVDKNVYGIEMPSVARRKNDR